MKKTLTLSQDVPPSIGKSKVSTRQMQTLLSDTIVEYLRGNISLYFVLDLGKEVRKQKKEQLNPELIGAAAMLSFISEQLAAGEITLQNTEMIHNTLAIIIEDITQTKKPRQKKQLTQ